jgi:hypothetical protein
MLRYWCFAFGVFSGRFDVVEQGRWFHRILDSDRNHKRHWTRGLDSSTGDVYARRCYRSHPLRARGFIGVAVHNKIARRTDTESLTR